MTWTITEPLHRVDTEEGSYWRMALFSDGADTVNIGGGECVVFVDRETVIPAETDRFAVICYWDDGWRLCLGSMGMESILPYTVGVTEKHAIDWVLNRRLPPSMLTKETDAPQITKRHPVSEPQ